MKSLVLDTGPVISLALNNMLWLFKKVKEKYNINFYITEAVKKELVDNPLTTKRFKFEALQTLKIIEEGTIEIIKDSTISENTDYLLELANSSFKTRNRFLNIVHYPEVSAISAALLNNADAIMIDERTTRYIIEQPHKLKNVLSHKLHTSVDVNKKALSELKKHTKGIKFIRSAEFVTVAFEKGMLDDFLPKMPNSKDTLLDALLWGLKLNGCAIATKDLEALKRFELKK
jgi:predicted nucleic acid-binding protein